MTKKALITGITGQDGSYLTELLLDKGYEVHGIIRRASTFGTDRIDHLYRDPHDPEAEMFLHYGDMADATGLRRVLQDVEPDEVYNLAAQSHVGVSYKQPEYTADVDAVGVLRLLDAIRDYQGNGGDEVRFYQAGTSEMFGNTPPPQNENTRFHPDSPYAASKVAAHHYTRNYREAYDLFATNGILFNHESPRRGQRFVTRKITRAVGRIHVGLQETLFLGNLDTQRDWGFAGDYVEAMWRMLQQDEPRDYVIATGEAHSVREFLDAAFGYVGIDWEDHVEIDPDYYRPVDVDILRGDPSKAKKELGWTPDTTFDELVEMMVEHDLEKAKHEKTLLENGHDIPLRGIPDE
jgi:GDPmannose 4,6-dehydratase